jgi:uncharacterized protein
VSGTATIRVEVACALPGRQVGMVLELPAGSSLRQAIEASGIAQQCPELDLARAGFGVFGRAVTPAQSLRDGDRVEIYRPLLIDPKRWRFERAARSGNVPRR